MSDTARLTIVVDSTQARNANKDLGALERGASSLASGLKGLIAPLVGVAGAMAGLNKAVEVQRQFDVLNSGLITATGSTEKAAVAFKALQSFAQKTPYDLNQAVKGFTQLVNLGLTPSEKAMMSYGNTASAMGKDLSQMIEAVADATTGEFERLKEFGIVAKTNGDKVAITFQGMTKNIGKSAAEIEKYLMDIGEINFGDGMSLRMKTLDGDIAGLADTWDTTFRLINEAGLGEMMRDSVKVATDALNELNDQIASGQLETNLAAVAGKFDGFGRDIEYTLGEISKLFVDNTGYWGRTLDANVANMTQTFREFPENVRAFIQVMTVEVLAGFDKVKAYARAFNDGINAIFTNDTFEGVGARLEAELNAANTAREGTLQSIFDEREASLSSFAAQTQAAKEQRKVFDQNAAADAANTADRLAQFKVKGEATKQQSDAEKKAAKDAESLATRQKKALDDQIAQSAITVKSTNAMADAYLGGASSVRELTIQQKVEEDLLKTGTGAREKVTEALNKEADARDRLDLAESNAARRIDAESTLSQAAATLRGSAALQEYNATKAVTVALTGKKIAIDSAEYKQLVETTKAQLAANKALDQAGQVQGIVDRLSPQAKLLREFTIEQEALNAAIAQAPENTAVYQDALAKLGREYEVNQSKATIWGQLTEGAIDRIDGVFADAWANIGSGADNLWDSLVKGAKQAFGEIAHMLTTKPLLASISNWLTGTDNGQGLGSVWGRLLGGSGGSSSSGGGGSGLGSIVDIGKTVYQAYSAITGVGAEIASGWASGGISGAINGGVGYYANLFTGAASTVSSTLASWTAAITGNSAAIGATQAGYTGAAFAQWAAAQAGGSAAAGAGAGATAGAAAGAGAGGAAAGAGSGFLAQLSAMASNPVGWVVAAVASAYQSGKLYDAGVRYDTSEVTNLDIVKYDPLAKASLAGLGLTDKIASKLVGGKLAAILSGSTFASAMLGAVNSKLFGGAWETKDGGISLGVEDGEFEAQQYIDQKKKGGLFSSSKKRTRYSELDAETEAALGGSFNSKILDSLGLFTKLGVQMGDSVLDGLNVASQKISTKGKTNEEIQAELDKWFTGLGDAAVSAISKATGSGIDDISFDNLKIFVERLYSVNDTLDLLNVGLIQTSVFGGKMAEQLVAWAGGMDAFTTATTGYYSNFFSETEKADDTLAAVRKQFEQLNMKLPESRDSYRDMVEAIDIQTEAGRQMFVTLTGLAESAASAYTILEDRASAAAKAAADAAQALIDVAGTRQSALQRAITAERDAATKAYNARVTSLNDMSSTASKSVTDLTSVSNSLSNALKALRGDSDDAVKMLQTQARATLQSALATARSGGSLAGFAGLDDALSTVSSNNTDLYGSMEDFARDQGRTANVVAELNALNGKQLTTAEKTVKALQDQIDQAKEAYDAQMAQFDAQLEFAQAQLDALNGVDNSVLSVAEAIKQMNAAVVAAIGSISGKSTPANSGVLIDTIYKDVLGRDADDAGKQYWQGQLANGSLNNGNIVGAITNAAAQTKIDELYKSVLGRQADAAGAKYWSDQVASGALTVSQLEQAIRNAAAANGSIKAYATGGLISGPGTGTSDSILARLSNGEYVMSADAVRMFGTGLLDQMNAGLIPAFAAGGGVGEVGPQLQITRPSQIYNSSGRSSGNSDNGSGAATVEVLNGLRSDIESNAKHFAGQLKEMAGYLDEIANGVQIVGTVETKAAPA